MILSDNFWTRIKPIQRIHQRLYAAGRGWIIGWLILLITHTGRRSGSQYDTPLQYEKIDGAYYVGAARGKKADWFRNIQANPQVHIQVAGEKFDCCAEPILEPERIADFLEYRLKRHPLLMGLMMKTHKLPMRPNRIQLVELAKSLAVVRLTPPGSANGAD